MIPIPYLMTFSHTRSSPCPSYRVHSRHLIGTRQQSGTDNSKSTQSTASPTRAVGTEPTGFTWLFGVSAAAKSDPGLSMSAVVDQKGAGRRSLYIPFELDRDAQKSYIY